MQTPARSREARISATGNAQTSETTTESSSLGATVQLQKLVDQAEPNTLNGIIANSATARYAAVTAEGLAYAVPGVAHALLYDVSNPLETGVKLGSAAALGGLMRVLLPEGGAGRLVAGTIMLGMFAWDSLKPVISAYKEAGAAKDMAGVDKAAQGLGDTLGQTAVDGYLGGKVANFADEKTGTLLTKTLGADNYSAFENFKVGVWNSDKSPVGLTMNFLARSADSITQPFYESFHKVKAPDNTLTVDKR